MQPSDTPGLLEVLGRHGVECIVVGVTAGVLQGAPVVTFDLDVVYRRTEPNLTRLLGALEELEAVFRNTPGRRIAPGRTHLASSGHKLLSTRLGPLDVLGSLDEATGFDELLPHSVIVRVGERDVRVLGLERLIEEKMRVGRPKDLAALPVLRATLALVRKG
jgi:hypothetical protein